MGASHELLSINERTRSDSPSRDGGMLDEGSSKALNCLWELFPPGLCVFVITLSLLAQGADGIRGLKGTKGEKVRICPLEGGLAQWVVSECEEELMPP